MGFLQALFFESPIRLAILAFALLTAALVARRRYTDTWGPRAVPGALALVALLFILQWAVVTDRERISRATDRLIAAVEGADSAALADLFSDAYDSEGMDKAAILEFIETALKRVRIYDTRTHRRDITEGGMAADSGGHGNAAELILAARATVSVGGDVGQLHWGAWRLTWREEPDAPDRWRITALQPRMLDGTEFTTLKHLRGVIP